VFLLFYESTHNFSIDWAMGYIYFTTSPFGFGIGLQEKTADAVLGKAGEIASGAWAGAGASAGAIPHR